MDRILKSLIGMTSVWPSSQAFTQSNDPAALVIVKNYLAAYSTGRVKKILTFYTTDIQIYDGAFNSTTKGLNNVKKDVVEAFLGMVPDLRWAPRPGGTELVAGNTVVLEWEFSGTPAKTLQIPDKLRKPFSVGGISVFKLRDGKIGSHLDYYNPPEFFAHL